MDGTASNNMVTASALRRRSRGARLLRSFSPARAPQASASGTAAGMTLLRVICAARSVQRCVTSAEGAATGTRLAKKMSLLVSYMPLAKVLVCLLLLPDVVLVEGSRHCAPAIAIGASRRASKHLGPLLHRTTASHFVSRRVASFVASERA